MFGAVALIIFGAYQIGKGYGHLGPKKDDLVDSTPRGGDPSVMNVPREEKAPNRKTESSRTETHADRCPVGARGQESAKESPNPVLACSGNAAAAQEGGGGDPSEADPVSGPGRRDRCADKGLNYLYIVRFRPENRDDAEHASKWLSEKGIKTTIEDSGGTLSLVSVGWVRHDRSERQDPMSAAPIQAEEPFARLQAGLQGPGPLVRLRQARAQEAEGLTTPARPSAAARFRVSLPGWTMTGQLEIQSYVAGSFVEDWWRAEPSS